MAEGKGKAFAGKRADELQARILARINRINTRVSLINSKPEIPKELLESFYITDKSGMRRQFKLWEHQKKIVEVINADMANRIPVRIIHDKPRQVGSSTMFTMLTYFLVTRLNLSAVIIGHKDFSSQNLYNKIKYAYKFDDFGMRGEVRPETRNKKIMEFEEGGRIQVVTAGSDEVVTGSTNQIVLATEAALWPRKAADQMRGLLNTVDDSSALTFVFIESTGRPGTDFQDRWNQAAAKKSKYRAIFVPWFDIKEYTTPFKSANEKKYLIAQFDDDDREIVETCGVTLEQMNWRKDIMENKGRGITKESKLIDFHSEYPATPDESFSCSDSNAFDTTKLNKMLGNKVDPIFRGELTDFSPDGMRWTQLGYQESMWDAVMLRARNGRLKVWEMPEVGVQYCAGMDIAEGIELKDYERDDSAMVMRRTDTGKVVLTWLGKEEPDDFGNLCHCLGLIYNIAYLCPEANSIGILTTKTLWKTYPKYAIYKSKIGPDDAEVNRIGYQTGHNKNKLIMQFSLAVKNNEFDTSDGDLLEEMLEAVMDSRGRVETNGKDILMAAVLSEEARLDCPNWNVVSAKQPTNYYDEWKKWKKSMNKQSRNLQNQYNNNSIIV